MLDIFVLAPIFVFVGIWAKKLPKLVRYALMLAGVGLIIWNAFDIIDYEKKNDADDRKRSRKKKVSDSTK